METIVSDDRADFVERKMLGDNAVMKASKLLRDRAVGEAA